MDGKDEMVTKVFHDTLTSPTGKHIALLFPNFLSLAMYCKIVNVLQQFCLVSFINRSLSNKIALAYSGSFFRQSKNFCRFYHFSQIANIH